MAAKEKGRKKQLAEKEGMRREGGRSKKGRGELEGRGGRRRHQVQTKDSGGN